MRIRVLMFVVAATVLSVVSAYGADSYLSWNAEQAEAAAKSMVKKGTVSGDGWRVMDTYHATKYKYRVTWLTPDAIRGTARLLQLKDRLSNEETQQLVQEAEEEGDTIFLIELDAIEGSGVIPDDWQAFLQPAGLSRGSSGVARGEDTPGLWKKKALNGALPRDYKYDRFWMVFSLLTDDDKPLIPAGVSEAELIIQVHGKEDTVRFPVPTCIREKSSQLMKSVADSAQ